MEQKPDLLFKVFVDDNFHYMDEDERYYFGSFSTEDEAVLICKRMVDDYLVSAFKDGMTAKELYQSYVSFGEDPFIVSNQIGRVNFSAWNYAKERCQEICQGTLGRAIAIAAEAHEGQTDKAGAPYIFHSLRMMMMLNTIEERIVAVLHDVVEDCSDWSFDRLRAEGFSETIIEALDSVTKREGEDYDDFVMRAASNPIGRNVKLADLRDNSDIYRILIPTEKDFARIEKYRQAIEQIERLVHAGDEK